MCCHCYGGEKILRRVQEVFIFALRRDLIKLHATIFLIQTVHLKAIAQLQLIGFNFKQFEAIQNFDGFAEHPKCIGARTTQVLQLQFFSSAFGGVKFSFMLHLFLVFFSKFRYKFRNPSIKKSVNFNFLLSFKRKLIRFAS